MKRATELLKQRVAELEAKLVNQQRQNQELQDFIENAPVGLHWVNESGIIIWANQAELDLLGYTKEDYIGHHIGEFYVDPPIIEDILRRLIAHETLHNYVAKLRCKNGTFKTILISSNVLWENGKFIHTRCFTRDITDRKHMEEMLKESETRYRELTEALKSAEAERERLLIGEQSARQQAEEANRVKDEFLAMVSHELRTPLTAILGWTRLLRAGRLDPAGNAHALETIERNVQTQSQLIEDLLDISRIITGKLRLDRQLRELVPIIEAAVNAVRPLAEAKNILLKTIYLAGSAPVYADSTRLQQVIWNLLSNAIKFTAPGGHIQIQLLVVGEYAEIAVNDSGQGINPEFLPYVFDRFRQADSTITRHHGGLGLGLAIVKHLVELHGGTVGVESLGSGQGATFKVRLPLGLTQNDRIDTIPKPIINSDDLFKSTATLDGLRLLVVEDEPDTRELLIEILLQSHAEVRAVTCGDEALAVLDEWQPDVLISDIGLPGMDGYQLIRTIRARGIEKSGRIPAIALTAYAKSEDRLRAITAGFQMHLAKPIEPAELLAVISTLIGFIGMSGRH
ncbi:MAG: ATP-binding protein [Acidobacteriota bacterium]